MSDVLKRLLRKRKPDAFNKDYEREQAWLYVDAAAEIVQLREVIAGLVASHDGPMAGEQRDRWLPVARAILKEEVPK